MKKMEKHENSIKGRLLEDFITFYEIFLKRKASRRF